VTMSGRRDIVLVVDDSSEALGFLTRALEQADFTALVAKDGASALELLDNVTPDLVLMDAVMPRMDGFETCRRIKSGRRTAHLPVIFMTGLSETQHVVEGLNAGGVESCDQLHERIDIAPNHCLTRLHTLDG